MTDSERIKQLKATIDELRGPHNTNTVAYKKVIADLRVENAELRAEVERFKQLHLQALVQDYHKEAGMHEVTCPECCKQATELASLSEGLGKVVEALKMAKLVVDYTAPTPYPNHSCSNPDSNCDGNCVDVVNHGKIQQAVDEALAILNERVK